LYSFKSTLKIIQYPILAENIAMGNEKDIAKEFLASIGENIKKRRKKKDYTMEQLGLEMGLTRMQVNRIEKGYNITMITLLKLSLALDCTMEQLLKSDYKYKKDDLERLVNTNKASKLKVVKKTK
jgi:DNA-binding Xre family transcriptional regulator